MRRPMLIVALPCFFFFQAEDGIRDLTVTGVQTCALPICLHRVAWQGPHCAGTEFSHVLEPQVCRRRDRRGEQRSEEHTSELQSQSNLVCRLLLEKKKTEIHFRYVLILRLHTADQTSYARN